MNARFVNVWSAASASCSALCCPVAANAGQTGETRPTIRAGLPTGPARPQDRCRGRPGSAAGATWKVWIKELDDAERLNFIERTTGFAIDPFAGAA